MLSRNGAALAVSLSRASSQAVSQFLGIPWAATLPRTHQAGLAAAAGGALAHRLLAALVAAQALLGVVDPAGRQGRP